MNRDELGEYMTHHRRVIGADDDNEYTRYKKEKAYQRKKLKRRKEKDYLENFLFYEMQDLIKNTLKELLKELNKK